MANNEATLEGFDLVVLLHLSLYMYSCQLSTGFRVFLITTTTTELIIAMHKQGSIRSLIVMLTRLRMMMRDGKGHGQDQRHTTAVAY